MGKGLILFIFTFSITTISPFSTSLTNFAPIISRAQVSEANMYEFYNFPNIKGLIPKGSLAPIRVLFASITKA